MHPVFRTLIRLQNPFMKWLLRSPFHGLVSRFYILITVTGRKSGQQYDIPVQYHQEASRLWVLTSQEYRWWHNLKGGAPVKVHLRGRIYEGCATPFTETERVMATARRMYPSLASNSEGLVKEKVSLEIELHPQ